MCRLLVNTLSGSFCVRTKKKRAYSMYEWYGHRDSFRWKAGRVVAGLIEETSKYGPVDFLKCLWDEEGTDNQD